MREWKRQVGSSAVFVLLRQRMLRIEAGGAEFGGDGFGIPRHSLCRANAWAWGGLLRGEGYLLLSRAALT